MSTILNATVTFGLVNIPVLVESTVKSETRRGTQTKTLHRACNTPIKMQRVCPNCNVPIFDADDLVSGVKIGKDEWQPVELDDAEVARSPLIVVTKFVSVEERVFLDEWKRYWLVPTGASHTGYVMLRDAMSLDQRDGMGICSLWGKEHPFTLRPEGRHLQLCLLQLAEDITEPSASPEDFTSPKMLAMAQQLTDTIYGELSIEDLQTDSRATRERLIAQQVNLETTEPPEPTIDLMESLRRSIDLLTPRTTTKKVKA